MSETQQAGARPQQGTPQEARELARQAIREYTSKRGFEAASRRPRTSGWVTGGLSANSELARALPLLRERSRDLARNDAYVSRAVQLIRTNVVGLGIRPQLDGDSELEQIWRRWAETTACDADGCHDLYGLQGLVMRAVAESGEVLVRMRPRRASDGLPVPLQLQVLESDHLDTSKDGPATKAGHRWIQGIEVDAVGRRTGYWLHRTHPGDQNRVSVETSVFVPAASVLHIYRMDRPGQMRGIPWAAPVAIRARELKDYEDAQLLRQKLAACYVAFVHQPIEDVDASDLVGGKDSEELGVDFLEPGTVVDLPVGKDVKLSSPPAVQNYDEFVVRQLRAVAVGLGVSYEALTGDYSKTNFSSGRMGHIEFGRNLDVWQHTIMIAQFCRPIFSWFQLSALMQGAEMPDARPNWVTPRREMIDPTREVPATVAKIRGGTLTLSDAIRAEGKDPEEVFAARAAEIKRMRELGLIYDSDPEVAKDWRMPDGQIEGSKATESE